MLAIGTFSVAPVYVSAETETSTKMYAQDTISGSAVLHCFDWSYNSIKDALPDIAAAGYTAVQTSPVQKPKDYNSTWTDRDGQWWKLYQPLSLSIADGDTSWLGTKAELKALCAEADKYNIKVIVDIVSNHLANDGTSAGTFEHLNSGVDADLKNTAYFHSESNETNDNSRYTITQYHLGMPDLNTGHEYIQNKVLGLLEECMDCGVDGFRFDAAKHIELPTDEYCSSQFWPTVIDGIKQYVLFNGYDMPYIYGEILGGAGTDISNYTRYIAVTDNVTGDNALNAAVNKNAAGLSNYYYYKDTSAENTVIWAESHDTYMGSSGQTANIDDSDIVKTWAIVGARADSTSLFLVRPNTVMGEASTDTTWKSPAVAEVNKFKNLFDGKSEYLAYSGNTAYIERGTKGVVISKLDGAGSVSLPAHQIADGFYTDHVSGNAFAVSDGIISGQVGDTGVAVVYADDVDGDIINYITASKLYLKPNTNWLEDGARFAMYLYNRYTDVWVDMTATGTDNIYFADVPKGDLEWTNVIFCRMDGSTTYNDWQNRWNQTDDLFPSSNLNLYTVTEGDFLWDGDGEWSANHSYGEPVWIWADNHSSAQAVFTCTDCQSIVTKSDYLINTVHDSGLCTYTATVTGPDGQTYTNTDYEQLIVQARENSTIDVQFQEKNAVILHDIFQRIRAHESQIDVLDYHISSSDINKVINALYNVYPELFFVSGYSWSLTWDSDDYYVKTITPAYTTDNVDDTKTMLSEFYAKADEYLALVDDSMDDFTKALVLHDRLVLDHRYQVDDSSNYTFMINGFGRCENYTEVYAYLLARLGIKSEIVSSTDMMNGLWFV